MDKFLDDASARRLGNGAAFYGKRKSNFYGANDVNKKNDALVPDPLEDYRAPSAGGYFQWMPDDDGVLRPVTRMKKQVVEQRDRTIVVPDNKNDDKIDSKVNVKNKK
jgi:hypothetical protein